MRRTRHEVSADILKLTRQPARITRIVYRCNLNFSIVHEYLNRLLEAGLLRRVGEPPAYEATDQGHLYVEAIRHARWLLVGRAKGRGT